LAAIIEAFWLGCKPRRSFPGAVCRAPSSANSTSGPCSSAHRPTGWKSSGQFRSRSIRYQS